MLPVPCSWNLRSERALSISPVLAVRGGWTLLWTVHLSLFVICPLQIGLLLCLSLSAKAKNGSQQLSVPTTTSQIYTKYKTLHNRYKLFPTMPFKILKNVLKCQ